MYCWVEVVTYLALLTVVALLVLFIFVKPIPSLDLGRYSLAWQFSPVWVRLWISRTVDNEIEEFHTSHQ